VKNTIPFPEVVKPAPKPTFNSESALSLFGDSSLKTSISKIDYGNLLFLKQTLNNTNATINYPVLFYNHSSALIKVSFRVVENKTGYSVYSVLANNFTLSQVPLCVIGILSDANKKLTIACAKSPVI
jgi:hypothetical protein